MRDDTPQPIDPLPEPLAHGGDLSSAEALYGPPPQGWVDLSTGINPAPYPVGDIGATAFSRLPEKSAINDLLLAARDYYGAPGCGAIAAAPGTQALIQWLPRLRPRSRVTVLSPTYAEHAHAWASAGHDVAEAAALEQVPGDTDVLIIVNPNNPNGVCTQRQDLLDTRRNLARRGGWLIVDEAFADVAPDISLAAHCQDDGLIILRSFGKFFGLAGLRLGFALCNPQTASRLNQALGPWSVSGPAIAVGTRALRDTAWIEQTRNTLRAEVQRLEILFGRAELDIVGTTDLFVLIRSNQAARLHAHLAQNGIWTRAFPGNRAWIRFGQPGTEEHWRRLETALDLFS
ncbi:MAG: threonine-phosphate decarboxylase [Rhodospirillales bacterium]|nr:threonine-phosphate decarboxylase [Rhodospirillales bacterium]